MTIGDGTAKVHADREDMIQIPHEYLVDSIDDLVDKVFQNIDDGYLDTYYASRRAILTPKMKMWTKSMKRLWTDFLA